MVIISSLKVNCFTIFYRKVIKMRFNLILFLICLEFFSTLAADEIHILDVTSSAGVTQTYKQSVQKQLDYYKEEIKGMEKELVRFFEHYRKKKSSTASEFKRSLRASVVSDAFEPTRFIVNEEVTIQFSGDKIQSILFEKRKSKLDFEKGPYTVVQECKGTVSENDLNIELKVLLLEPEFERPLQPEVFQLSKLEDIDLKLKLLKYYKSALRDVLFQMELLVTSQIKKTNVGVIESIKVLE